MLAGKVGLEDAGVYDVIVARCSDVEEKFRFVRDTVGWDQTVEARRQLRIVQPVRERVVQVLERIRIVKVVVPGAASKLRSKKENPPFVAFGKDEMLSLRLHQQRAVGPALDAGGMGWRQGAQQERRAGGHRADGAAARLPWTVHPVATVGAICWRRLQFNILNVIDVRML